jgi:sulfate permease, SulP family
VIAFVNSLEVLTCTMALESRLARRVDANRALLASAAGSAVALAAGGLPVAGGMAASLANVNAGARTRRSALAAAAGIAALAVAAQAALAPLPLAALAGVTLAVAAALAWTPLRQAWQWCVASRRAGRVGLGAAGGDGAIAALVTGLLLSFGSAAALVGGVMAASLLALLRLRRGAVRRTYDAPRPGLDTAAGATRRRSCRLPDDVRIVEVGQPLLFANVEAVVQALEAQPVSMRRVIVDLTRANAVDHSAARTLAQCGAAWAADGRALIVVRGVRARDDDWPPFDGCTLFDRLDDALTHAFDRALHKPSHTSSQLAPAARATPIAMPPRADAAGEPAAERATRLLLPLLGPIAPLLVRRAERGGASDEQRRQRLALHLPEGAQRQAFLRAMTNQDINLQGPPRAGRCPSRPPEGAPENLGRPGVFLKEPST